MARDEPSGPVSRALRLILWGVDRLCDVLALSMLALMVVVVTWQVFGRYVLGASPRSSSEIALLLLGWVGFLGIAIGIRERSHIALELVVERFPPRIASAVSLLGPLLMVVFGLYLIVEGWGFTRLMGRSTLPSTGLPTSVRYAAMPVSGVLITLYSVLQLLGVETRREIATADDGGDPVPGQDRG